MPTRHQRLLFSASGLLGLGCALAAAVATGLPCWVTGTVVCRSAAELVNATGAELEQFRGRLSYGLFLAHKVKRCGLGERPARVSVFPDLLGAIPAGLHVAVLFFCGAATLLSSVASGFFFFNALGRPYETLHGPTGLYLWSFTCGVCSCLVLVLFASEVNLHQLSDRIANFNEGNVFRTHGEQYGRCFWLFLLVFLLHGLNMVLIRLAGIRFPFQDAKEAEPSGGAADLMY
ncbi:clarin-1 [Brachionichthys hirsutus]|uniref:clarin-1 n=1 Tax=Brachionichthys hirsutus TaxID=412623 RepID=UPI0036051422